VKTLNIHAYTFRLKDFMPNLYANSMKCPGEPFRMDWEALGGQRGQLSWLIKVRLRSTPTPIPLNCGLLLNPVMAEAWLESLEAREGPVVY
jgi:hypothetical protein